MNLKQLREKGAFVSIKPVKKTVTWKHRDASDKEVEEEFDIHVIKLSYGMVERISSSALMSGEEKKSANAQLIVEAIRLGDDAKERFTYLEAYQLQPSLARTLIVAIAEVNALPMPDVEGDGDPKELAP